MSGLEFLDVHKSFGAVQALRGVSFAVDARRGARVRRRERRRQVHAAQDPRRHRRGPTAATCGWTTRRFDHASPRDALAARHRHGLSGAAGVSEPERRRPTSSPAARSRRPRGRLDEARDARAHARAARRPARADLVRTCRMEHVSAAHAQLVQVARALAFDCRVLVLDEPTTSLTDAEVDHLFRDPARAQGARRDAAVRLAPAARGVPAVRSHHRAARRRATSARSIAADDDAGHDRAGDGRPRAAGACRARGRRRHGARRALSVRGPDARARGSETSRSTSGPARSSASSGWSDRAAPSCSRRSSAWRSQTPAAIAVDGAAVTLRSARDAARAGPRARARGSAAARAATSI